MFEGGYSPGAEPVAEAGSGLGAGPSPAQPGLEELVMGRLRHALTLDLLEKAAAADHIGPVILVTDQGGLAAPAAAMGAVVLPSGPGASGGAGFHFGRHLQQTAARFGLGAEPIITLGGAACPLASTADFTRWARMLLEAAEPTVIMNNPMSPDITGFTPARVLQSMELPDTDNALGYALRQRGLERVLLPLDPRLMFDLDTPTDALILSALAEQGKAGAFGELAAGLGPRSRRVLQGLPWDRQPLLSALEVLKEPGAEILLAGRVGPSLVTFINKNLPLRVRVLSEERGMKALGRLENGQVRSLMAHWLRDGDFQGFFSVLADTCHAAFIDTRVLFAHGGRRVSDGDRWASDVARWQGITDTFVRDFTRAAAEARLPVVLGGHTLVLGGVWTLAASAAAALAPGPAAN